MVPLLVLVFNAQGFPSQHVLHMAIGIVVINSMLAAPLGAALAHRLPVKRLRTLFAVLLYLFAVRMLVGVW